MNPIFGLLALYLWFIGYHTQAAPHYEWLHHQESISSERDSTSLAAVSTVVPSQTSNGIRSVTAFMKFGSAPVVKRDVIASSASLSLSASTSLPSSKTSQSTASGASNPLPLQPSITPALSLAGVILMFSGAAYALVGIKSKWLQIFLSAAYLTSLAITVLIIYVMNPPISHAVQGAYFVAIFIPGVLFGAGSIVFKDVTEGLGCLLGGFCLSMWFLVLKPGGLIATIGGRAIFIGIFCVAVFALSFSHYTRPYGLIGATSFAGATAIVLGIDCFSRAGLKEFWIYIWALNDNLFPDGTSSYPITRGIRVEIASIVLISLLGAMSQMRIWKTVRERRGKKIQQQLEQSCRREQDEEELGRRLEEDNERERAIWEAAYGKRDSALLESTDSGIGTEGESSKSTRRPSMNVESRQLASATESHIELDDLKNPNSFPSGGPRLGDNKDQELAVATVIKDDTTDVHVSPTAENPYTGKPCVLISSRDLGTESSIPRSTESSNSEVKNPTRKSHVVIIRKPVGGEATVDNNAHEQIDDGSSPATYVTSQSPEAESLNGELCLTRAIEFSKQSQRARSINLVAEGLCIPTIEEDRTSSIAATLDALEDYSGTSEDLASVKQDEALASTSTDTGSCAQEDPEEHGSLLKEAPNEHVSSRASIYTDADAVAPSLSPSTLSQPYSKKLLDKSSEDGQVREQVRPTELPLSDDFNDRDRKFVQLPVPPATGRKYRKRSHLQPVTTQLPEGSFVSDEPSVRTSLERQLPAGTNKVVVAHRTNEWAKRLNRADKPELEELRLDQLSPELTRGHMDQPPVPVDMEELRQTAAGSGLESISESMHYVSRSSSNTLSISVGHQPTQQLQVASNKRSLAERPNGLSYRISHENPSSKELRGLPSARTPLHPATMSAGRATRSSSSPLITSLIEGDEETSFPSRCAPGVANNTLIAQRDSMVRDRYSSISKSRDSQALRSATSLSSIRAPIPQGSLTALDDDIPLSQRRSLIQMQQSQSPDSRRPFRSITDPAQQESLLAAWRSSIQQDIASAQRPQLEVEARRTEMMNEKRISSLMKQQAALAHRTRKETRDQEIKRGLHDLHREGIHRMQAKANKNLQDL